MGGRSSNERLLPNSPIHLSSLPGWIQTLLQNIESSYLRYNIPYLLDKPGTGHQVIIIIVRLVFGSLTESLPFPYPLWCIEVLKLPSPKHQLQLKLQSVLQWPMTIDHLSHERNSQVKGEVYLVDEAMLSQLDILEDHPTYYRSPWQIPTQNLEKTTVKNRRCVFVIKIGALHNCDDYCNWKSSTTYYRSILNNIVCIHLHLHSDTLQLLITWTTSLE